MQAIQTRAGGRLLTVMLSAAAAVLLVTGGVLLLYARPAMAQEATLTPLPIIIVTRTPTEVIIEFTPTPSRTPTQDYSLIRIEAIERANIRTAPSLDSEILGQIVPGRFFAVSGRYGQWLQIYYDRSPTGFAWVYGEIVRMSGGDPASIPEIDLDAVPSPNVATADAQRTAEFLTQTPGAPETATALQASATGVFTRAAGGGPNPIPGEPLPTFTYPPPFVEATLPARTVAISRGGLPPIVPIAGLAAIGILGLFISSLRRGR